MYTVTLNKNVADWNTSFNLQYSRQTYWDIRKTDYYTVSVNRYFNVFGPQGVAVGLSASRSKLPAYIRAAGDGDSELQWQYE